jgi:hypothetical protein
MHFTVKASGSRHRPLDERSGRKPSLGSRPARVLPHRTSSASRGDSSTGGSSECPLAQSVAQCGPGVGAVRTAQALEVLGVTVGIVALPEIGADLGLPDSQRRLVVSLSAVLYGSLLVTAGRVADVVDKRLVFAVGMALTLAGAVCCALAGSVAVLLLERAAQGLGGAVVTPAALSLPTSS